LEMYDNDDISYHVIEKEQFPCYCYLFKVAWVI
jgi:hypothetical protein